LEVITPPELRLKIIRTTHERLIQDSETWLAGNLVLKSNWHSKITILKPYVYVDEMLQGRFKLWKHVHTFRAIDKETTEVIDEIDFELPYGLFGRLFSGYAYNKLEKIFAYRKESTMKAIAK
jgi:ligand-binding SRPBCC domain-containing protein